MDDTRQTHQLVRVQFSDQTTLIGTPAHPIWSVSDADWVELEELDEGDLVLGESGPLEVVSTELIETLEPVYNLEVYGEHVYHVENSGILVHNGRFRAKYKGPKSKRQGGVYVLVDDANVVRRTGRTKDLARRMKEHLKQFPKLVMKQLFKTNHKYTQRGLSNMLYTKHRKTAYEDKIREFTQRRRQK